MTIGGRDILNARISDRSNQKVKNKSRQQILKRPEFPKGRVSE